MNISIFRGEICAYPFHIPAASLTDGFQMQCKISASIPFRLIWDGQDRKRGTEYPSRSMEVRLEGGYEGFSSRRAS